MKIFSFIFVFILIQIMIYLLATVSGTMICTSKYKNSYYAFIPGCMVEYKGEYITEELYKKSFEQNLILNQK